MYEASPNSSTSCMCVYICIPRGNRKPFAIGICMCEHRMAHSTLASGVLTRQTFPLLAASRGSAA